MSKTTFSGPVVSQSGFVTPTFTSTTLPYFVTGNVVFVSDLNTLAYGGADQWYSQASGAGLGTGGNVGPAPGPTTYTTPADYNQAYVNTMGGTSSPMVFYQVTNAALIAKLTSLKAGDTFTTFDANSPIIPPPTITVTATGPFVDNGSMGYEVVCNFSEYVSFSSKFEEVTFA